MKKVITGISRSVQKLSIVIATHNRAHFISDAIQSILNQSYRDWELIIIDDFSSDNTLDVVSKWQKICPQIIYIKNASNLGISKTYNIGFLKARGKYIAILDDDDQWSDPEKLQKQVEFLDANHDYVGCGGGMIVIDVSGKELYRYLTPQTDARIKKLSLFVSPMANSTTLFRKDSALEVGLYDESIQNACDKDFWLNLGSKGKLYNFGEYFAYYRVHDTNNTLKNLRNYIKDSSLVMSRYKNKYPYYFWAKKFYTLQYLYTYIPRPFKKAIHHSLASFRKKIFQ
ncbi:MAG: glycosyltransferase family 2 protein [Patescibacteria group bacterium]